MLARLTASVLLVHELGFRRRQGEYFRARALTGPLVVPQVYQPVFEPDAGRLVAVFVESGAAHLLFADEVHPIPAVDTEYRKLRAELYGRTMDIESVEILGDDVDFADAASGPDPYEASVHWSSRESYAGALYSNTWNHMLSARPHPLVQARGGYRLVEARIIHGSRAEAEAGP